MTELEEKNPERIPDLIAAFLSGWTDFRVVEDVLVRRPGEVANSGLLAPQGLVRQGVPCPSEFATWPAQRSQLAPGRKSRGNLGVIAATS